ncbi:unnamed protein product [Jaminaea pallidilutea]
MLATRASPLMMSRLLLLMIMMMMSSFNHAAAEHVRLDYHPINSVPESRGMKLWCEVGPVWTTPKPIVDYVCFNKRVAVWNADHLPNYTLEFATPCGGGGYAIHDYIITSWCRGPLWFVCAVFQRGKDKTERICYGLDWRDDGE